MHRRQFLAATGVGMATATAGCLAPTSDTHPLAGAHLAVRIDAESDSPHDLYQNARESLEFWEEQSEAYVGFSISFEVVEDDPDMVIAYADTARGCENIENYSERVMGCAPLIRPGRRVPEPITARVVAGNRPYGKIRITTKHEIGHILGLDHDQEPLHIMSNQPADRIPLYELRLDIWEGVQDVHNRSRETTRLLNHGIEMFGDGEYTAAEAAFGAANTDFAELRQSVEEMIDRTAEFEGHPRVETVALETLQEQLEQIKSRMAAAQELTAALARASRASVDGDTTTREEALGAARGHITTFNEIGSVDLNEIAIALGLVRRAARDEPVVDLEEDDYEDELEE